MSKRTLTIAAVAIVLVILLVVFENPFGERRPSTERKEEQVQLFIPISEEDCSRIELSGGFVTTTTLIRKGRQWFTKEGYKADPNAISQLFRTLQDVGEPELVSMNRQAFVKFRVDQLLGIHLRMYDMENKPRVDLIVGELDRDFFHTPVRKPDSNNVYRIRGMLRSLLRRPSWRDFNILRLDQGSIQRVTIRAPDEVYTLEREMPDGPWHFAEPTSAPVDTQTVNVWLRMVANLRASEFEPTTGTDALTSFGLAQPHASVSVEMEDGTSYTVVFGNQVGKQYYAKRLDEPQIYRVRDFTYKAIIKKSADLKPRAKPKPPQPPKETPTTKPVQAATTPTKATARPSSPTKVAAKPTSPPKVARPVKAGDKPTSPPGRSRPARPSDKATSPTGGRD